MDAQVALEQLGCAEHPGEDDPPRSHGDAWEHAEVLVATNGEQSFAELDQLIVETAYAVAGMTIERRTLVAVDPVARGVAVVPTPFE